MATQSDETRMALLEQSVIATAKDISEIKRQLEVGYVPVQRYNPVEKIVFGMVGLFLVGVGGALLSVIIKK